MGGEALFNGCVCRQLIKQSWTQWRAEYIEAGERVETVRWPRDDVMRVIALSPRVPIAE